MDGVEARDSFGSPFLPPLSSFAVAMALGVQVDGSRVLDVLVVNFFTHRHVKRLLESLPLDGVGRIVIVDNSTSRDEEAALRALMDVRPFTVIVANHNLGFGAGVNLGIDHLTTFQCDRHVWILNPDITLTSGAFSKALDSVLEAGEDVIVSPLILRGDADAVWFAGGHVDVRRGVAWHWDKNLPIPSQPSLVRSTRFVTGAAPLVRPSTLRKIGMFREDFFLYWEDAELSLRAQHSGFSLLVDTRVKVRHFQGGATGTEDGGNSPEFYYYNQRNRLLISVNPVARIATAFITGLRETLRLLVKPIVHEPRGRRAKCKASCLGVIHGLMGVSGHVQLDAKRPSSRSIDKDA